MKSPKETNWTESDLPLDRLLTEGQASGCIVTLSSSERPPLGWAGMLDWRTRGAISSSIRAGIFSGETGECSYFPWSFHGRTLHILLVGVGKSAKPGLRGAVPATALSALEKNLKKLSGGIQWVASRSDFPEKTWSSLAGAIPEGGGLWITA
jgi:hypothetical protein